MQFITKGPDVPDTLLKAHEDGHVVFFCGAGISYPAELPSFRNLVDDIYVQVGTDLNESEQETYDHERYDATLDLLERRLPGQRMEVRKAVYEILKPNLRRKGAKDTHIALIQLARSSDGKTRLITTNFDRIFECINMPKKSAIPTYVAPFLPVPKNSRWNGLVYLHGLLPKSPEDEDALHQLVLTSGDFGLAYLIERWASRFVSELFREYRVCFIGYSINDPVLRYMMDALAADRMQGEIIPQAYAFGDISFSQESNKSKELEKKAIEWKAKGVSPILYEVPSGTKDHSALHQTLRVWANTYRDGITGKERIVVDYAMTRPSKSTKQDDFVGRMLWAISDKSGLPAKQFANFNPAPTLDWLKVFSEERYLQGDLNRFGVAPNPKMMDSNLTFSLIKRPTPHTHSPLMRLVSSYPQDSRWDEVMSHLALWILRHLNNAELILWIAQQGGQLHKLMVRLIDDKLNQFAQLEKKGDQAKLDSIRHQSPDAIPEQYLRPLWRVLLTERVKSHRHSLDLYQWQDWFESENLNPSMRIKLREILAPKIELKAPFRLSEYDSEPEIPKKLEQVIDWKLVLTNDHVRTTLLDLTKEDRWNNALPSLLNDFQQLLFDALDMLQELEAADSRKDQSYLDLPSISPHDQNQRFKDWVALIELVRDSWLAVWKQNTSRATNIAQEWFELPYPTFKRLALFAASKDECIESAQWIHWLTKENAWWLWSIYTKREVLRLLVLQGCRVNQKSRNKLEKAIMAGPPRSMYRSELVAEEWQELKEHSIWLYLAKLQSSGGDLGSKAVDYQSELEKKHPEWRFAENESDEFSVWIGSSGDDDWSDIQTVDLAPSTLTDLIEWLKKSPVSKRPFRRDNWREICSNTFPLCARALSALSREGKWPAKPWDEALRAWSEDKQAIRSWIYIAPLIKNIPDDVIKDIAHSLTWWLEIVSKVIERYQDIFINLCKRILTLPHQDGVDTDQPVTRAINHPVGHITQALLNLWFRRKPSDNEKLPSDLEPIFSQLCDTDIAQFSHGRVLLASRLVALFRVDPAWTETKLLPLLDWSLNADEAAITWQGFLWSPRIYPPLTIAFEKQLLDTVDHYEELGESAKQFAAFLTYLALDYTDTYPKKDLVNVFKKIPQEGLNEASFTLTQALSGAGEKREEYWTNRIKPFWHNIWPKSLHCTSVIIAENLAQLSITAASKFPEALDTVYNWLKPIEYPFCIIDQLHESELPNQFPESSLKLLDVIILNQPLAPKKLDMCLKVIEVAKPELRQDDRFKGLSEYLRRHRG